jgi:hypothetical protein
VAGSSVCSLDRVEHLGTLNVSHVLLTLMKLWYSGPYRIGRFADCDWEKGIFTCQGKLVYGSAMELATCEPCPTWKVYWEPQLYHDGQLNCVNCSRDWYSAIEEGWSCIGQHLFGVRKTMWHHLFQQKTKVFISSYRQNSLKMRKDLKDLSNLSHGDTLRIQLPWHTHSGEWRGQNGTGTTRCPW